jgi:hypothetical protein
LKFPKTTRIQTKQIVYTLLIVICTIDRNFVYILHCNIQKKIMKPKPNVVMEHLDIYGKQKTENLMNLKSNVVMEHLQIYGVLWCDIDEAQTKTFKRTSTTQNKLPHVNK